MNKTNLLKLLAINLAALSLFACQGGSGKGNDGGNPGVGGSKLSALTEDGSGDNLQERLSLMLSDSAPIPQVGSNPTSTHVYIYNTSDKDVGGISYAITQSDNSSI